MPMEIISRFSRGALGGARRKRRRYARATSDQRDILCCSPARRAPGTSWDSGSMLDRPESSRASLRYVDNTSTRGQDDIAYGQDAPATPGTAQNAPITNSQVGQLARFSRPTATGAVDRVRGVTPMKVGGCPGGGLLARAPLSTRSLYSRSPSPTARPSGAPHRGCVAVVALTPADAVRIARELRERCRRSSGPGDEPSLGRRPALQGRPHLSLVHEHPCERCRRTKPRHRRTSKEESRKQRRAVPPFEMVHAVRSLSGALCPKPTYARWRLTAPRRDGRRRRVRRRARRRAPR